MCVLTQDLECQTAPGADRLPVLPSDADRDDAAPRKQIDLLDRHLDTRHVVWNGIARRSSSMT